MTPKTYTCVCRHCNGEFETTKISFICVNCIKHGHFDEGTCPICPSWNQVQKKPLKTAQTPEITEIQAASDIQNGEIVIDGPSGRPRQAGATETENTKYVDELRRRAEASLFIFTKGILNLSRLSLNLHLGVCRQLQRVPPHRKMMLLPRDHLKSSIVGRGLPIHLLIQPESKNVYIPNFEGASTRILLAYETATNAEHQLRWIEGQFESNQLLRGLWPEQMWENPRRDSSKWSAKEMTIPRKQDFPEASIETIGVGGAVVGRHYAAFIKDDLVTLEAANSEIVMQDAIDWHITSRALLDDPDKGLEWILGTKWAIHDMYQYIEQNDPTVEVIKRSAIEPDEDGNMKPIFPEMFSLDTIARLKRELGVLFPLLYMNSVLDPALVDFDEDDLRFYRLVDDTLIFEEDHRDTELSEAMENKPMGITQAQREMLRGDSMTPEVYDFMTERERYLRFKAK